MAVLQNDVRPGLGHYVWWFPGAPLKVHLSLDLVRRLSEQLHSQQTAAGEGVLLGKAKEGATEVLDFVSAAGRIPEAVATLEHENGQELLVGYYRIESGGSLRPKETDVALARTWFAKPCHVFLLIQVNGFGPPSATFFFHDGGGQLAEFSLMEFPFDHSLLAAEERDRLARLKQAAARQSAAIESAPTAEPGPRKQKPSGWTSRSAFAILLLVGTAAIAINARSLEVWWTRIRSARVDASQSPPRPSSSTLGLRAKRDNVDVEITWNRELPTITAATSGVLSIQDGNSRREITLDRERIRHSTVVYSPVSDTLFLQLSVMSGLGTVIESVMMLLPNTGPPKLYTLPAPKTSTARPLKPFVPPGPVSGQSEAAFTPMPVVMPGPASSAALDPILMSITGAALLPPPTVRPNDTQSAGAAKAAIYYAAEPVNRVVPRLTPQLVSMVPKPVTLEVRVTVDKIGRVTRAESIPHAGINRLLMNQLVSAARSWKFKPARQGEDTIASEFVIQFYFRQ